MAPIGPVGRSRRARPGRASHLAAGRGGRPDTPRCRDGRGRRAGWWICRIESATPFPGTPGQGGGILLKTRQPAPLPGDAANAQAVLADLKAFVDSAEKLLQNLMVGRAGTTEAQEIVGLEGWLDYVVRRVFAELEPRGWSGAAMIPLKPDGFPPGAYLSEASRYLDPSETRNALDALVGGIREWTRLHPPPRQWTYQERRHS